MQCLSAKLGTVRRALYFFYMYHLGGHRVLGTSLLNIVYPKVLPTIPCTLFSRFWLYRSLLEDTHTIWDQTPKMWFIFPSKNGVHNTMGVYNKKWIFLYFKNRFILIWFIRNFVLFAKSDSLWISNLKQIKTKKLLEFNSLRFVLFVDSFVRRYVGPI